MTQEQPGNIKCLISKCDKGKTVKDTPYLSLILEDATGVLDAKFWNLTNEQIEQYKAGQIVEVFGDSIIHRNAVQLRVRKMVVLEGEDISDYVRLAPMSRTEMEEEVKTLMNEITDSNLYCVVEEVLEETKDLFMRKCLRCGTEMKENCAIKVEGAGYGIVMSSDENKLFGGRIGKPKVAICPKCGEVSIYVEDVEKL